MNQWDTKPSINEREMRGQSIAQNFGMVRRVDETTYMVHSQRLDREYRVEQTEMGWLCARARSPFRNRDNRPGPKKHNRPAPGGQGASARRSRT